MTVEAHRPGLEYSGARVGDEYDCIKNLVEKDFGLPAKRAELESTLERVDDSVVFKKLVHFRVGFEGALEFI